MDTTDKIEDLSSNAPATTIATEEREQDLRLYAVLRSDIQISSGKAIAQCGHAYVQTFIAALADRDPRSEAYARLTPGTKITLDGGSLTNLIALRDKMVSRGIPHALITDRDHLELPDFDGSPTVTALGIGPITRSDARRLLSRLPLWGAARSRGGAS
ncbi:peptidyl-tRNA hydrolase [Loktanella sp. DJP18]|uniref:peptidyl-tRNA hydrolase n=1 Tax=Loktanella sp. DJP18 TaxID=3409788 RepID=UPI003BB544FE